MCSRKASRLAFRAGLSRLLRWAYFSSRSAISPLQIKQLTRSGTQARHPRASPVHSLVTVKARVVLRDLVAQGAKNPQLVALHRFLPAAYGAATRRNPPVPRAALGTRWSGLVVCTAVRHSAFALPHARIGLAGTCSTALGGCRRRRHRPAQR